MFKTLWKEFQRPKFYFIKAADRDGIIPKRKPAEAQPSDKKVEEISKRPDTALANRRTPSGQRKNHRLSVSLEWCRDPVKMRANELKLNFSK